MKVLMVDADPNGHAAIAAVLTKRGCQLLEAGDCEEALRVAHKEKPAIAIVDVLTPDLDRGDFVGQLRHDPAVARMPVIFYTDGYLEIASGLARDVAGLLSPMLLCEEAIRNRVFAGDKEPVTSSDRPAAGTSSESGCVQEVFNFACGIGGKRDLIKPGDLIAEIVDKARATFPKSIEITSAYSEDLWLVEGDRLQLGQVLTNLFGNARDAMPRGGSLLVWVRNCDVDRHYASMTPGARLGQYIMLRVSDTGRGTPRPLIDTIFNPFLESKEVGPGTNLGLVKSHGGFMSVYSQLGRGTTFQIFLPAKVPANAPTVKRPQTVEALTSYLLVTA